MGEGKGWCTTNLVAAASERDRSGSPQPAGADGGHVRLDLADAHLRIAARVEEMTEGLLVVVVARQPRFNRCAVGPDLTCQAVRRCNLFHRDPPAVEATRW